MNHVTKLNTQSWQAYRSFIFYTTMSFQQNENSSFMIKTQGNRARINLTFQHADEKKILRSVAVCFAIILCGLQYWSYIKLPITLHPDSFDYLVFSKDNWGLANRSPIYSLFNYLFLDNPAYIVVMQYTTSTIAMIYFWFSSYRLFNTAIAKITLPILFLMSFYTPSTLIFNSTILTESLNGSFFLLLMGVSIHFAVNKREKGMVWILLFVFLLSFLKLFNGLILMMVLPIYLIILYLANFRKLVVFSFCLVYVTICMLAITTANVSGMQNYSFKNIISNRVVSQNDKSILNYLANQKFPAEDVLMLDYTKDKYALNRQAGFELQQRVDDWYDSGGKYIYLNYLILHPSYSLVLPFSRTQIKDSFSTNISTVQETIADTTTIARFYLCYYYFDTKVIKKGVCFLLLILLVILLVNEKSNSNKIYKHNYNPEHYKKTLCLALYCIAIGYVTALITWHLDAMEAERHVLTSAYLVFFGRYLFIAIALAYFYDFMTRRLS